MIDEILSRAVVAYLGKEWSPFPRSDVEAVSALAGDDPETLIARVREIEAETMAVEVDWSTRTLSEGGRVARAAMAERHPELSEAALDALYWAFTYNWR